VISVIGVIGYATGVTPLGMAAAAAGLVAAFLNGVFGLCLGCEMYLMISGPGAQAGAGRGWPAGTKSASRKPASRLHRLHRTPGRI
jgi:hypothetical protein